MKTLYKKAAGLILSAFLALGLGSRVNAAGEDEALPAPAPTEAVEPAPEAETVPPEEAPAAYAQSADSVPVQEAAPAGAVPAVLSANAPLQAAAAGVSPNGSEEIGSAAEGDGETVSSGITVGGADAAERSGWSYDEATGQLGLVNYNHPEASIVSSGEGGLSIAASGYNWLRSIVSLGDVNITGTGLLLLESVTLGENSGFYLHTPLDIYREGTGSVAVFLKTGENQYTLANGSVVGLLDEQYAVSGVDLVVPDGSALFLNSGGTVYDRDTREILFRYTGDEGEALVEEYGVTASPIEEDCSHGIDETYGALEIGAGASLTVEDGGAIHMESTQGIRSWADIAAPAVSASDGGRIVLDGDVTGDGRIYLDGDSSLSGEGSASARRIDVGSPDALADCGVTLSSPEIRIHGSGTIPTLDIDNSGVFLHNTDGRTVIESLDNTGDSLIVNQNDLEVGPIANSGTLTFYSDTEYPSAGNTFNLTGAVSGGSLRFTGGVFRLTDQFALEDGAGLDFDHVIVYDFVGAAASSVAPLVVSPGQVVLPALADGRYSVPLVVVKSEYSTSSARGTEILSSTASTVYSTTDADGNHVLDLRQASSYAGGTNLLAGLLNDREASRIVIELHSMDENGEMHIQTATYWNDELDISVDPPVFPLGDVFLVRITATTEFPILPSATITSTSTSFTGSGILGGSGAGSLTGGSGYMIFRQSQNPHTDPGEPDPEPDPDPSSPVEPGAPAQASSWRVEVSESGDYYVVSVYNGTQEILRPGRKITARMPFALPGDWDGQAVFAVFRNADGTLTAFRASYSALTGVLSFDTDLTGSFALVCFPYDGEPFSDDFYAALAELELVRALPVLR